MGLGFVKVQNNVTKQQTRTKITTEQGLKENALQVQTLLLAPICPHTCEHVWRNKLHEKGSVVTAGWPQAPQPNTALQVCFPHALHLLGTMQPLSWVVLAQGCNCPGLHSFRVEIAQGCKCPALYLHRVVIAEPCICQGCICPGLYLLRVLRVLIAQPCVCPALYLLALYLPRVVSSIAQAHLSVMH